MKNYASNRAQKGKLAYRTPSQFIYKKCLTAQKNQISKKQKELNLVTQQIITCRACRLANNRFHTVAGEGVIGARYFIIGQAPGANEDKTGRPFIGRAGKFLTELLTLAGINRERETFITSLVKCFPTPPPKSQAQK